MHPTPLCIVARSMSRLSARARTAKLAGAVLPSWILLVGVVGVAGVTGGGCDQLDARNRIKHGNRMFRETQFIDAVAEYQRALKVVDDPIIHYNLGLAYQKVVKVGYDGPILLGTKDDFVCREIPNTKLVEAGACVKPGDRHFAECGSAKTAPIEKAVAELTAKANAEADAEKKKELQSEARDKQDELARYTCSSSFRCMETTFCSLTSPEVANTAAEHFQIWIKAQPSDDEIKRELAEANRELDEANKANNKTQISLAQKRIEDLLSKDQTRKIMTRLWTDSDQHQKALDYWESLLKEKPNDPEIMGALGGINLLAGNWRKSIEWYNKVADIVTDPSSKVAQYVFIGNVAWAKLNSKSLIGTEAIEVADRGIGALQKAVVLDPRSPKLASLQASIFNFRSTAHGASFASAIDRATAQDLAKLTRVLVEEAKKAQGQATGSGGAAPAPAPGTAAPASGSGGSGGAGSGSAASPGTPTTPPATPPASPGDSSGGGGGSAKQKSPARG
jgi:tetratricopeptide (TPR) repeat protein